MIDIQIDMTPLETRITALDVKERDMSEAIQECMEILYEDTMRSLDEGGSPTPFVPTKRPTGRPPLGGSGRSIGQSIHISEVTRDHGTLTAGPLPYIVIHQLGGIIEHPGSDKFQSWIAPEFSGFKFALPRQSKASQRIFTHGTLRHQIPIPARRYMRFRDTFVARMKEILTKYFMI